uniref:Uncharacterized protein n=1 Tax=Rhizophora mucronata TaxID=61149 RepID=A0A2P2P709_RHIMU
MPHNLNSTSNDGDFYACQPIQTFNLLLFSTCLL